VPDADTRYREKLDELTLNLGHFAKVWRQIQLADIQVNEAFLVQLLMSQEKVV
jgi:hypothetical protein